jgi:hypothetical protein
MSHVEGEVDPSCTFDAPSVASRARLDEHRSFPDAVLCASPRAAPPIERSQAPPIERSQRR